MTTETIGIFETLIFLGQFVSLFWVNGLTQAFSAIYPKVAIIEKKSFISSTFIMFFGLAFISSALLIILRPVILPFLIESSYIEGFYWYCLFIFFNTPTLLIPLILMLKGDHKELFRFTIFYGIGYLLVFLLNLLFGGSLKNLLLLLNIFAFCLLVLSGGLSLSFDLRSYRLKWLKRLFLIGSPLILYSILSGLAPIFDAWLVQRIYSTKAVFAIYKYGAREFPLTITLVMGLGTALIPLVSEDLLRGMNKLKERSIKLYPFVAIVSILLILTSKYFFPVIFNNDFASSADIFNIYILIILVRMLYPQVILLGMKKTKSLLFISIIELFVNMLACTVLGIYLGLVGIAGGTLIACMAGKAIQIMYVQKRMGIKLSQYLHIKPYIVYSAGIIFAWIISLYLP